MINERELTVVLRGKGKTKKDALGNALSGLQKKVGEEQPGIAIRIEPLDIRFISGEELRYTERFMFFFMKRDVSEYSLEIEADIRVLSVDENEFNFEVKQQRRLA